MSLNRLQGRPRAYGQSQLRASRLRSGHRRELSTEKREI